MKAFKIILFIIILVEIFAIIVFFTTGNKKDIPINEKEEKYTDINWSIKDIQVPAGYERIPLDSNTFAEWLRNFPLKPYHTPVYCYNGELKANQNVHFAVLDIDAGNKDLQQCADAVIRLRAEYLYSTGQYNKIHFNFTSGHRIDFIQWAEGYRPIVNGNSVIMEKNAIEDFSYINFRQYLEVIFQYAGTMSLSNEMAAVEDIDDIRIGDVFIQGGFPGHSVIVVDLAKSITGDEIIFLIAQGYMPAQDIHILKNLNDDHLNPWYSTGFDTYLLTPQWRFTNNNLKRFE
jgi:hypothetical protein